MVSMKIVIIIPYRGIGDLIYHLPLLKGVSSYYKCKLNILTNSTNKAKILFKNEKFVKKIEYLDFTRENQFRNSWMLYKKINILKSDLCIVTAPSKRLILPLKISNAKKKIYFKKDSIKDISKYLYIHTLKSFKKINFKKKYSLNFLKINSLKKKFFFNIDSHHNQNNWDEKYFIKLIDEVIEKIAVKKIFINFSPKNKKNFFKIKQKFQFSNLIEFTYNYSFKKLIDKINSCEFIIGNESGPNCIGASLHKKVISLYNPKHTPYISSKIINKKNYFFDTNRNSEPEIIKKIIKILSK